MNVFPWPFLALEQQGPMSNLAKREAIFGQNDGK